MNNLKGRAEFMVRLVRAEWYRFWRSSNLRLYLCLFLFICIASAELSFLFLSIMTSVSVGILYYYKTGYYEIIAGHKISHIILSKVCVDGVFISVVSTLAALSVFLYTGMKNGFEGLGHIPLRITLFTVIMLRVGCSGVLFGEIVKSPLAAILAWMRSCIGMFAFMFVQFIDLSDGQETIHSIYNYLMTWQAQAVLSEPIKVKTACAVCVTSVIEVMLWYSIAYITMKRKLYR